MATETQVLNDKEVKDRIKRIAWQIYEEFQDQPAVLLAGIAERGFLLAELLKSELDRIADIEIGICSLQFDKDNPIEDKPILHPSTNLNDKNIVLVDDVLKSGSTLIYGVKYFLDFEIRSMKTVVLVDRNHKRYPVKADFKGLSLSTSLQEHVSVNIESEPYSVEVR